MSARLFAVTDTLVGVLYPLNIQVLTNGFTPGYVEVHNHSNSGNYLVLLPSNIEGIGQQVFLVPAGSKLGIPGPVGELSLLGVGAMSVFGGEGKDQLPNLDSIQKGTITSAVSPMDNVTLQDTGLVSQIKALGVSTAQLAASAVTFAKVGSGVQQVAGQAASCILDGTAANVGDLFRVTYGGVQVVYEMTNGGAPAPGNIGVDLPTLNVSFPAALLANQPNVACYAFLTTFYLTITSTSLIQAGTTLTVVATGGGVATNVTAAAAESRQGIVHLKHTVTASTQANGFLVAPGGTITGWTFHAATAGGIQIGNPLTTGATVLGGLALKVDVGSVVAGQTIDVVVYTTY